MSLSVITAGPTRRLSRLEHVKAELGSVPSSEDATILRHIDFASSAIESYCHRAFAREEVSELVSGFGGLYMQLKRTPVVSVTSVLFDGTVITDFSIEDRDEGTLYRKVGWDWAVQANPGLTGRQRWPGFGAPLPEREEPRFTPTYFGGYILPEQYVLSNTQISAAAADNSFNAPAGTFPALLKTGDIAMVSGFVNAGNNGRFVVSGTPTSSKIVVASTLITEGVGPSVTVKFQPHASCRPFDDLEKACIEATKAWYLTRSQDPGVVEKQVGQLRIRRGESDETMLLPLPASCVGLLAPWVRRAA